MPEQTTDLNMFAIKIPKELYDILKRDLSEFVQRQANGHVQLHFHKGVVQKIHSLQVN